MKILHSKSSAPLSIEEGTISTHEDDSNSVDAKESFSDYGENGQEISATKFNEVSAKSKVQALIEMTKSLSQKPAIIALRRLCTPSIFGAIIGLTLGIVSPFRRALVGEHAPLRSLQGAISLLGDGAIPATTLIMGGNLVKGFHKPDIKISAVIGVVIVRYVLLPLTGVFIVKGAIHIGILHPDPLYQFVLLVQFALPPAMNMGVVSQLLGAGESECSVIFFWTYALTLVFFPLWSAYFMWLVS